MKRVGCTLRLEKADSIYLHRRGIIHSFTVNSSKESLFQSETGNTLEGMRMMEIAHKIPHDLIVEQAVKELTVSCQLLHKWRLPYV